MQTALSYRTNRDLFSNYYLDEHLPETKEWDEVDDEELRRAREDVLELWEREKDTAPNRNESQLEEKFVRPMFRLLGIPFEVEESTSRTQRRPDYGFFESEEAARNAFDRREEGGAPDTRPARPALDAVPAVNEVADAADEPPAR